MTTSSLPRLETFRPPKYCYIERSQTRVLRQARARELGLSVDALPPRKPLRDIGAKRVIARKLGGEEDEGAGLDDIPRGVASPALSFDDVFGKDGSVGRGGLAGVADDVGGGVGDKPSNFSELGLTPTDEEKDGDTTLSMLSRPYGESVKTPRAGPTPTTEPVAVAPGAAMVCDANTAAPLTLVGPMPSEPFFLLGQLSDARELQAYQQIPLVDDVVALPTQIAISPDARGLYAPLIQPFGLTPVDIPDADQSRLTGIDLDPALWSNTVVRSLPDEDLLDVLVVGDAGDTAVSGLDRVEQLVAQQLSGIPWRVHWAELRPDGTMSAPVVLGSMKALSETLAGRTETFDPDTEPKMRGLVEDVANIASMDGGPTWAKIYWIVEGLPMPFETPAQVEQMIAFLEQDGMGNLLRRSNGKPRSWLEVIAGKFVPEEAGYLISGPIQKAGGTAISIETRPSGAARTVILTDPNPVADRFVTLVRALRSAGTLLDAGGGEAGRPTQDMLFATDDLLSASGIVIDLKQTLSFVRSSNQVQAALAGDPPPALAEGEATTDLLSLAQLTTDESGVLAARELNLGLLNRRVAFLNRTEKGRAQIATTQGWVSSAAAQVAIFSESHPDCTHIFVSDAPLEAAAK